MKRIFRSFYGRISAIFLALLLALVLVQIAVSTSSSLRFVNESEQKLSRRLAADIAREFEPFMQDEINYPEIEHAIHYLMVINPRIEIYLLDQAGRILTFFAVPKDKVQLESLAMGPIEEYLADDAKMPILGDDPRNPGKKKPFSVAPIETGRGERGYLYVILGSEQYDSVASMIRGSFITRMGLLNLLAAFVCTGIAGLVLFAVLTRRLQRMTSAVMQFEQGDYSARVGMSSDDEIGQLAGAFDQMADTIVANMDELRQTDDLRRELVANVSHDLRSPLASIQGYLETIIIKEKALSPEERQRYFEIIFNNTTMLSQLVGELFELSKLEARQIKPNCESFAMAELAQDVVMKFQPMAEESGIRIEAVLPQDLPPVFADIALVERALSNLIDNGIRYTGEGGEVKVELRRQHDTVCVAVSDTGKGIPAEELPRIFERFYHIDKRRTRGYGGAGLGLAIAERILEIHGSQIQIHSVVDQGTTFSFLLGPGPGAESVATV